MSRDFEFRQILRAYRNGIIDEATFDKEMARLESDHWRVHQWRQFPRDGQELSIRARRDHELSREYRRRRGGRRRSFHQVGRGVQDRLHPQRAADGRRTRGLPCAPTGPAPARYGRRVQSVDERRRAQVRGLRFQSRALRRRQAASISTRTSATPKRFSSRCASSSPRSRTTWRRARCCVCSSKTSAPRWRGWPTPARR